MVRAIAASMGGETTDFQSAYLMVRGITIVLGPTSNPPEESNEEIQNARQHADIESTESV